MHMKFFKRFPVALLPTVLLFACQPASTPEQQLLDTIGKQVILTNHQDFSGQTGQLQQLSTGFCANPDAGQLERLRQQWRDAMAAWQRVKLIGFGPILVHNQSWKIQFWPDKKNLVRRKAEELLNGDDPLTVERVDQASVVVQGLSALEYLLFDQDTGQLANYQSDKLAGRRCQLLQAVSQHTHKVAQGLSDAWQNHYLQHFTQPGPDNTDYPDSAASMSALLDALVTAVEVARHDQLGQPLGHGARGDFPRPFLAEAWRSRYSSGALHANLEAARALYLGGDGFGFDDYLRQKGQKTLADKLSNQFSQVIGQSAALPAMFDAVNDKLTRKPLEQIYQTAGELLATLKRELPPALGLSLGFNANDGD